MSGPKKRPRIDIPWAKEAVDTDSRHRQRKRGPRQPYQHLAAMLAVFIFLPATFAVMRSWQRSGRDIDEMSGAIYVLGFFAGIVSLVAVIVRAVCKDRFFGKGWRTEGRPTRAQFAVLAAVETFCVAFFVVCLSLMLWLIVAGIKQMA